MVKKNPTSLDIKQCVQLKINRRFERTYRLHSQSWRISQIRNHHKEICFKLISSLAYSSRLKMETTCSSETSVDFRRSALCYVQEYRTLHLAWPNLYRGPSLCRAVTRFRRECKSDWRAPPNFDPEIKFLLVYISSYFVNSCITWDVSEYRNMCTHGVCYEM
jgi:hypothetical protein